MCPTPAPPLVGPHGADAHVGPRHDWAGVHGSVRCRSQGGLAVGDNRGEGVSHVPLPELRRLTAKAGVAFEVYILKNKIRTL